MPLSPSSVRLQNASLVTTRRCQRINSVISGVAAGGSSSATLVPSGWDDIVSRLRFGTRAGPTSFPYLDILSPYNLAADPQDPGFRFQMTFWAIVRSPLFIGLDLSGDLTAADLVQLTNPGVLAVNSHSTNNRQVKASAGTYVWAAEQVGETAGYYVALLNHGTQAQEVRASFAEIGVAGSPDECDVVDVWTGQAQGTAAVAVVAHLPAVTGARLLWLKDCRQF
jgi:hypothetical protein